MRGDESPEDLSFLASAFKPHNSMQYTDMRLRLKKAKRCLEVAPSFLPLPDADICRADQEFRRDEEVGVGAASSRGQARAIRKGCI